MAAAPGRGTGAAVVDEQCVSSIVAVGLYSMAAGADVVMRVAVVCSVGNIKVPGELLVELVPPCDRGHVPLVVADPIRVVVVLPARITHRRTGMRPTDGDPVRTTIEVVLGG